MLATIDWWWGGDLLGRGVSILDLALRLIMAVFVVMRRRPVPITLAWLVLVTALPFVGVILYVLVGESRLGARRLKEAERIVMEIEPVVVARWHEQGLTARRPLAGGSEFEAIARDAMGLGGFPPLAGNRLELMADTDALLRRLAADIDGARTHVHLLYYIWMEGGLAGEVYEALERAAQRGVDCRVLADSVGSSRFLGGEWAARLARAGVRVDEALPASAMRALAARLDLRNHRKIGIVDGTVAYCGSQNLTDTSFHFKKRSRVGPWIDASVRMEGPAVQALAAVFLRDWALEDEAPVKLEPPYLMPLERPGGQGAVVQVVPTGPGPDVGAMREALLTTIYAARRELTMTTPYFVPDEATLAALTAAARRGVRVTIVLPLVSDSRLVAAASRSHFEELLESGVTIMRYRHGLLHAKLLAVDGTFSMIGSANIDARSFWLNFEVTLFVYDQAFTASLVDLQRTYLEGSEELRLGAWQRRGRVQRGMENVARLFGPIL